MGDPGSNGAGGKAAEDARYRLELLGAILAEAAHELNNALVPVLNNIESCLDVLDSEHVAAPSLGEARAGAQHIAALVRGLGHFSQPGSGAACPASVGCALKEALTIVGASIRARGRLVVDMKETPPVLAASQHLVQVFVNLLTNARDALPDCPGGVVLVSAWTGEGGEAVIEVKDNGIGMDTDQQARIFERFYTTKQDGTGLGLYVCRRLVQSLGGEVDVKSGKGSGTTLTIRLPPLTGSEPAKR